MKLRFRQRIFSWLDSYDVYDENGQTAFTVKGKVAWGHKLHIHDAAGVHVATLKERVLQVFRPKFEMYVGEEHVGTITKEITWLKPRFTLDCRDWRVQGNWIEWDYAIEGANGRRVAAVSKELWQLSDTYVLDVEDPQDALYVLMVVLAIDAEKCSRDD